jgi:hypothetical protein
MPDAAGEAVLHVFANIDGVAYSGTVKLQGKSQSPYNARVSLTRDDCGQSTWPSTRP